MFLNRCFVRRTFSEGIFRGIAGSIAILDGEQLWRKNLQVAVVVITGASSRIGQATAEAFAVRGSRFILAARNGAALSRVAHACNRFGAEALPVIVDVGDATAVKALVEKAFACGQIDFWLRNAGIGAVVFCIMCFGLVFAVDLSLCKLRQGLIGLVFLDERLIEQRSSVVRAELHGPGLQGAVPRKLVVLDGLSGGEKACIKRGRALGFAEDLLTFFESAIDGRAGLAARRLSDKLEHLHEPFDVVLAFPEVLVEGGLQVLGLLRSWKASATKSRAVAS